MFDEWEALGKRWLKGEVLIKEFNGIKFNKPQRDFINSKESQVLISGGMACVAGETRILTSNGEKTVEELWKKGKPFRVLSQGLFSTSWNTALPPIQYKPTRLFKVKHERGEFVSTENHRVLTSSGWKTASQLSSGDDLLSYDAFHPQSTLELSQQESPADALCSKKTDEGSQSCCQTCRHSHDRQLLDAPATSQGVFPSPTDALARIHHCCKTDAQETAQVHTRRGLWSFLRSRIDSSLLSVLQPSDAEGYTEAEVSARTLQSYPASSLLQKMIDLVPHTASKLFHSVWSHPNPTTRVLSCEFEREDVFYDFHVIGPHNYFAEGVFHHNSGKTTAFIIKMILLCLMFPGNRILLGRKSRSEIERSVLRDFFDVCPKGIYNFRVKDGIIQFGNGSEIILFGLEASQSGEKDIRGAQQDIKGLNLGGVFIDQLEEVEERVVKDLLGRMRRKVGFRQMCFNCNPANFWALDYFKLHPRPGTRLIETSMLDNKDNLPPDYISNLLTSQSERWIRKNIYGEWTTDALIDSTVFSETFITAQGLHIQDPIRSLDGITIYHEMNPKHTYQIGIDPSEGSEDPCSISVVDKDTGEKVAKFSGYVPMNVIADKAVRLAIQYTTTTEPLIVPESNATGAALIEELKRHYDNIYARETYNQRDDKTTKKLGFNTNFSTKGMLIDNFDKLLQKNFPKIRDRETIDQLKTFIYTNDAQKKGAGAQTGFHDDEVMSTLLAYWKVEAPTPREERQWRKEESGFGLYTTRYN